MTRTGTRTGTWKGTSRQRSGKGAIRKRFPLQKPRWEKTKLTIRYLYHETIVSRMGSYFPNRWPLSYLNLTKNMKTYIRRQQHKKIFKHQDIKQKEPPQKYRLGTISNTKLLAGLNRFYMAITSPSASAVVHNTWKTEVTTVVLCISTVELKCGKNSRV